MTRKIKQRTDQKKASFFQKFIFRILLFALIALSIFYIYPYALKYFNQKVILDTDLVEDSKEDLSEEKNIVDLKTEDQKDDSIVSDLASLRFSPDLDSQDTEKTDKNEQDNIDKKSDLGEETKIIEKNQHIEINPYEKIIEQESFSKIADSSIAEHQIHEYRLYLYNMNKLIEKFQLDKEFSSELYILKRQNFPSHIKNIISSLEKYNNELVNKNLLEKENNDKNSGSLDARFLSNFIKIKHLSSTSKLQHALKKDIKENLNILQDYIFSVELQESFFSNN